MDSVYYVRSVQPDLDSVLPLLKSLAYSKEYNLVPEIIDSYNRQQEFFKREWEPVHRNNHYACQTANEQFSILEAFETTIHSLKFGSLGLNRKEKLEYFKKYIRSQYDYYYQPGSWRSAIEGWQIYSPYYLKLRLKQWVGPPLTKFNFIEPYIHEIDSLIVDDLFAFFENNDSENLSIKPSFEEYELDYLCGLISLVENANYNEKLVQLILTDKRCKPAYVHGRIFMLIKNEEYKNNIKSYLLQSTMSDNKTVRLNALYGLIVFSDEDVIAQYERLIKEGNIGDLEQAAIEAHLKKLPRQDASVHVKKLGAKLLEQLTN